MQVLLLGMFVAVFLHDATTAVQVYQDVELLRVREAMPQDVWPYLGGQSVLLIVLLPKLMVGVSYWGACRAVRRELGTSTGQRSLNRLEAMTAALPLLLLCLFIIDLAVGSLRTARVPLQNIVLLDEIIVLLPTLLVALWAWSAYYPVDRRLREALIMRDADAGRPVYPLLPRAAYVLMQARHQFGLLLIPLLAVFAWAETMTLLGPDNGGPLSKQSVMWLSPLGVLIVFVGAPLVIRHIWQTRPLPVGEIRDRMLALCEQHKVRVRELLLWQTSGRMINAAVTGLVSKVRYILLSDGLLDRLGPREVEAVMAHEIAHVKLKHLIWMGLVVIALLGVMEGGGYALLDAVAGPMQGSLTPDGTTAPDPDIALNNPDLRMAIVSIPAFLFALLAFGWVSRRIERQADVFAVKHLALTSPSRQYDPLGRQVFDSTAIETMVYALQRVSELNHAPISRKSWRHGSIAWRQEHLRSLLDQPLEQTPVDRVLVRVKVATVTGLAAMLCLYLV
ncbi:MAG: M48 family metallopeptidase [Planctomycetota bacterium]